MSGDGNVAIPHEEPQGLDKPAAGLRGSDINPMRRSLHLCYLR